MIRSRSLIYAELLSNIRQVSVIAALCTPCDSATKAALSPDSQQISLYHDGETTAVKLPGQVSSDTQLQKPALGNTELSWRLPLAGQLSRADVESTLTSEAPWSAKHLGGAGLSCRECKALIVQDGIINVWKDLPSENWAEMMEFWHCHKPDVEPNGSSGHAGSNGVEDPVSNRGYGANTKFVALAGTGFVDTTTFLLSISDCYNLETTGFALGTSESSASEERGTSNNVFTFPLSFNTATKPSLPVMICATKAAAQPLPSEVDIVNHSPVFCISCNSLLGRIDNHAAGMRLYKWALTTNASDQTTSMSLEASQLVATQLLSLASSQMLSRFILLPLEQQKSFTSSPGIHAQVSSPDIFVSLWVLTPTIRYSTSLYNPASSNTTTLSNPPTNELATQGQLAMKLFWKVVNENEAVILTDKEGVEDVVLPNKIICELRDCLENSAQIMPPSSRRFQEWNVGLLDRYEER